MQLPDQPVDWLITYGNPRKERTPYVITVRATHAGEAKRLAKEIAKRRGITGRMGTVRMVNPEAVL